MMIGLSSLLVLISLQASSIMLEPDIENRAQGLMREIRCMVCAGESIFDSNAPMAQDMRRFVREGFASGADEDAIRQDLLERYGHEVLMRPVLSRQTAMLWIMPLILFLTGGGLLLSTMQKRSARKL